MEMMARTALIAIVTAMIMAIVACAMRVIAIVIITAIAQNGTQIASKVMLL